MRVLHWITPLLSLVITCAIASSGYAQIPSDVYPGDSYWAQPSFSTNNPNVFVPPGMQGNFQPYPGIDQFQWGWQQTRNENGIWIQDQRRTGREYRWGAEFLRVWFDRPGKRVFGDGDYDRPTSPISLEIPRIPGDLGTTGFINPDNQEFAPRSLANMFKDDVTSTGLKLFWGWENEDDSAVMFNAWWTEKGQDYFLRGADPLEDPIRDPLPGIFGGDSILGVDDLLFPFVLNSFNGGVAVDDGTGNPLLIPFDQKYEMNYSVQAWGAGVTVLRAPIRQGSWYKLRPVIGLRYLNLKEHLAFSGLDSGAEYEITSFEDGDLIGEGVFIRDIRRGIINLNTTGSEIAAGRPELATFNAGPIIGTGDITDPYEASLSAKNQAHIVGPEVGLRLDAGGKRARVWGSVVGGVAMNNESQQLRGFGFFNHFIDTNFNGIPDGQEFVADSVFEDDNTTTHVSPIFEATAALELDVLRFLPILNRNDVFANHSMFRVSYSYLYVGEVTRPAEAIDFVIYPANPRLRGERRGWDMQTLSLSAEFDY